MLLDKVNDHAAKQLLFEGINLRSMFNHGSGRLNALKLKRIRVWIWWLLVKTDFEERDNNLHQLNLYESSTTDDILVSVIRVKEPDQRFFIRRVKASGDFTTTIAEPLPLPLEWEPLTPESFEAYYKRLIDYRPIIQNNHNY